MVVITVKLTSWLYTQYIFYRFSLQDLTEENTCDAFSKGVGGFCWQNTFLYTGSQVKNTDFLLCSQGLHRFALLGT